MEINASKRFLKPYCLEGKNGPYIFKESIIILDLWSGLKVQLAWSLQKDITYLKDLRRTPK